jgi:SAM-dependent methyltransferase
MKPDIFATYTSKEVVDHYDQTRDLFPSERALFGKHLRPGMSVLDVGVGAGRTARHLSAVASRYVGIDYSQAMVRRCQHNFPDLSFRTMDATDMAGIEAASFDAVVFSFNGIDTIPSATGRRRCLGECARVLKPGGVFLFSVHNARYLLYLPMLAGTRPLRRAWRVVYALGHTLVLLALRLPAPAFWRGWGFVWDPPSHGSPRIYVSTPSRVAREAESHGLRVVSTVPGPDPGVRLVAGTPWYEYACVKAG